MRHPGRLAALGAALFLGLAPAALGQFDRSAPVSSRPAIRDQTRQLSRQVNQLTQEIDEELGEVPQRPAHGPRFTRELAQAVDEFRDSLDEQADPNRARQAFAAIDGSWNHLQGELVPAASSTRGVARTLGGVDQIEAQLRNAIGLNPPPTGFYAARPGPHGRR